MICFNILERFLGQAGRTNGPSSVKTGNRKDDEHVFRWKPPTPRYPWLLLFMPPFFFFFNLP